MKSTHPPGVSPPDERWTRPELVILASSTGGPEALASMFRMFPRTLPAPMIVIQHMPPVFTTQLAERLASLSGLAVTEGTTDTELLPGRVVVAPGDHHLVVRRRGAALFTSPDRGPPENSCRPSADVTMRSAAAVLRGSLLAVVLTGLGRDGCAGARAVVEAGGRVLAQNQSSSVAWGMPGSVVAEGLAERVLPLSDLAPAILTRLSRQSRGASP